MLFTSDAAISGTPGTKKISRYMAKSMMNAINNNATRTTNNIQSFPLKAVLSLLFLGILILRLRLMTLRLEK